MDKKQICVRSTLVVVPFDTETEGREGHQIKKQKLSASLFDEYELHVIELVVDSRMLITQQSNTQSRSSDKAARRCELVKTLVQQ